MKSETIYEIMLSVLSEDATEDEHRLLNEWLACSEANRKQFEQVGELYRSFETVGKQDDSEYDVEQAWMRVRNQTVEKKKKFNLVALCGLGRYCVFYRTLFYEQTCGAGLDC